MARGRRKINIELGTRFNSLTVLENIIRYNNSMYWRCLCDCGKELVVSGSDLRSGHTKTCGCRNLKQREPQIKHLYNNYKYAAEKRNHIFNLNIDEFKDIISRDCYYCGEKPIQEFNYIYKNILKSQLLYNGIDRIDNSIGYYLENCVACCKICNFAKGKLQTLDFISWIKKAYNYQIKSEILKDNLDGR